jgi:DNA polymerase-3 subunit delta
MPLQKLVNEIKSDKIAPYYYFYGAERFLLGKAVKRLTKHLIKEGTEDFNLDRVSVSEKGMDDILSSACMLPMMAERRLIIIRDAEKLKERDLNQFLKYAESPSQTTCMIFISNKESVDKRLKFFTAFKKKGEILEFKQLYENKLPFFIKSEVKGLGKMIADDAMSRLIQLVGNNLLELDAELTKIALGIGDKKLIDKRDVEEYSSDVKRSTVFELSDSLGSKDLANSLKILKKMLDQGEYPTLILGSITRHFNNLFMVREKLELKVPKDAIAKAVRVHPYFLNKYITQAKRLSRRDLRKVVDNMLLTDIALKSRKLPGKIILEKLFFDLCL